MAGPRSAYSPAIHRVPVCRDAESLLEGVVVGRDCADRTGDRLARRDKPLVRR